MHMLLFGSLTSAQICFRMRSHNGLHQSIVTSAVHGQEAICHRNCGDCPVEGFRKHLVALAVGHYNIRQVDHCNDLEPEEVPRDSTLFAEALVAHCYTRSLSEAVARSP